MKQILFWLRCRLRPCGHPLLERTRRFEFLESRICFSASSVSTYLHLEPVAEAAEVIILDSLPSDVETTISEELDSKDQETQSDEPGADQSWEEEVFDEYQDDVGMDPDWDSCTNDDLERNLNSATDCDILRTLPTNAETLLDVDTAEASTSQDDHRREPSNTPFGPAPAEMSRGSNQLGPQLQPVEQLSMPPITASKQLSQPVVSRTSDSNWHSPDENLPQIAKVNPKFEPNDIGTLDQNPAVSVLSSVALKRAFPFKATLVQSADDIRPQLAAIPSIMPRTSTEEVHSVEEMREPRVVQEQLRGTEGGIDTRVVEISQTGENAVFVRPFPGSKELTKEIDNRKPLWVGAIIAGWIAAPRRAKGRLVENIQARTSWVYSHLFRRDKSSSSRPVSIEEADE